MNEGEKVLEVVFVSSDDSEEGWRDYMKHHGDWLSVPYAGELRSRIKKHYNVCAGKEMDGLGIATRCGAGGGGAARNAEA